MKFRKYFFEVIVIFASVMLAFIAEDWREERQDQEDFDLIIEEIKSNIRLDSIELTQDIDAIRTQIMAADRLLKYEPDQSVNQLIQDFMIITQFTRWADYKSTGITQLRNSKVLPNNSAVIDEINRYYTYLEYSRESTPNRWVRIIDDFKQLMIDLGLPPPDLSLDPKEKNKIALAITNPKVRSHVHHIKQNRQQQLSIWNTKIGQALRALDVLEGKEDLVQFIALVGNATGSGEKGWDIDIRMKRMEQPHLWVLNQDLSTGFVKFRANGFWALNWGNSGFPNGKGYRDGPNIPVDSAYYQITFNSLTGEYRFEEIE